MPRTDVRVYLLWGKREEHTRNPVMAEVGRVYPLNGKPALQAACRTGTGSAEWNQGGHFHQVSERFVKALRWLMEQRRRKRNEMHFLSPARNMAVAPDCGYEPQKPLFLEQTAELAGELEKAAGMGI